MENEEKIILLEVTKEAISSKAVYTDREDARQHVGALFAKKYLTLDEFNELTELVDAVYPEFVEEPEAVASSPTKKTAKK